MNQRSRIPTPRSHVRNAALALVALASVGAVAAAATAPTTSWVRTSTATGSSYAQATGVSARPDGTAVVSGLFTGAQVDFGGGTLRSSARSGSDPSTFTEGLGADGSVRWVRASTATASSATQAYGVSAVPDGTAVATGYFSGSTVDFGDGTPRSSSRGGSDNSMFTEGLGADGSVRWVRTSTATGSSDTEAYAVSARPDGTAVVSGYFIGASVDFGDGTPRSSGNGGSDASVFAVGLGEDGSVRWVRTSDATGSSDAEAYAVSALPGGTAVVSGRFQGSQVDFGDGVQRTSANGGNDTSTFTEGLGADGSVHWVRTSTDTGSSFAQANGVSALPDGTAVVSGFFWGSTVDFGDGVQRTSANGGSDPSTFSEGLGADGSVRWVRTSTAAGGTYTTATAVSALPDGTAVVSGSFMGASVDFGDGTPRTSSNSGGDNSVFTEGLGADGSVHWVRTSTATGSSNTEAYGVSALPDGTAVVSGLFLGAQVDLGDGTSRSSANGGSDKSTFTENFLAAPSAPTAPVATAGDASASVSITPLVGGSVTSYTVSASTGGGTCTIAVPSTSCTVTGLAGGTSYTFTATATNATGTSDASAASNAVTPSGSATAPAAPSGSSSVPPSPTAPAVLPGRTTCAPVGVCTTSGAVPEGATRVTQIATGGTSQMAQMAFGARATARVVTNCKITTKGSVRTYTCRANLGAGRWTLTTQAKDGSTVIAQSVKRVTVKRNKRLPVTG